MDAGKGGLASKTISKREKTSGSAVRLKEAEQGAVHSKWSNEI
jgi:hypothetical protein